MTMYTQEFIPVKDEFFTPVERDSFNQDGFIIIRNLVDPIQVEQILQVTDEALLRQIPPVEYEADLGYPGAPTSHGQPGGRTPRRFQQALLLPGTHKVSVNPAQLDTASFLRTDLSENQSLLDREVCFALDPGDVIFFHCLTFHAAGRNRSTHARKSVLFTYRGTDNFPIPDTRSAAHPELFLA